MVTVTDPAWLCLFFSSPRALALIHLLPQRQGRKKDFQSTEWGPAMQSPRDDVYLRSWIAVKSLFQRSGASERRGCLLSVNEIKRLSENQELWKGGSKQRLSILGCVHHSVLEICDTEISWLRPPIWSSHGGPGLVAGAGSSVPCCRAERGSLGHTSPQISTQYCACHQNCRGVFLTCQGALPLAPLCVKKDNLFKFMMANRLI